MKIWICAPFELNLPGDTGRKMRYTLLAEKLAERGHSVVVWSADINHLTKSKRPLGRQEFYGVEVRLVKVPRYRRNVGIGRILSHWVFSFRFCRQLLCSGAHVDLILVSMPPLGLVSDVLRVGHRLGVPVCVDVQDLWPETFVGLLPRVLSGYGHSLLCPLFWFARRNYRLADGVCAVSSDYADVIRRKDLQVFGLSKTLCVPVRRARTVPGGILRLVYVGNLGVRYRMAVLREGVARLLAEGFDISLDVAGDGPNWICGEGIVCHGYLDEQRLRALLSECHVGLVPMPIDSCVAIPNKLVDYCESGLAVVSGLPLPGDFGFQYDPDSVADFVRAIKCYLTEPDLLTKHAVESRRVAENLFDSKKISAAFADFVVSVRNRTVP